MKELSRLEMKYATGGRARIKLPKGVPHPVDAITRAMKHIKEGNQPAALAELQKSPEAMQHPNVQAAMAMMTGQGQAQPPMQMADGGEVDDARPVGSSSPGSPGVSGAIRDAVHAIKDYVIDRPRREIQADRERRENTYINGDYTGPTRSTLADDPGYADGGKVKLMHDMLQLMTEHAGLHPDQAAKQMGNFRAQAGVASPAARQLSEAAVARAANPGAQVKKPPAQLAQELQAGFVHPADLNHLLYTDPTLTPLINRYQSGIDNQNLTPQQKQALIAKLQQLGPRSPPQLPQTASTPQGIDALLSGPQQ